MTAGPLVTPEAVQDAVGALVGALTGGTGEVNPDTFATVAAVRDGLLDVVRELDVKLADHATLEHASHAEARPGRLAPGCYVCELQAGERVASVTLHGRWSR